jgi:xanthine dehydrogenase iron-sulfur cluster and FAD-binding subunit A
MTHSPILPPAASITDAFGFTLNGEPVTVDGIAPTTTLLDWLRRSGRTGSKCGCAEGDCGACSVAIVERTAAGQPTYRAINSCIALLPSFAGREVVTVEGLACGATLHPVQQAMVEHGGSQWHRRFAFRGLSSQRRHGRRADQRSALRQSLPLHRVSADP